jgi:predicted flap endonuclease-1-like 5' DNA nuclease
MPDQLTPYIPYIILGLVLLVVAVWLIMRMGKTTDVVGEDGLKRDVLDEGSAPARRNQALIDAAPAAVAKNFGETSAKANTDRIAAAPASADAEAGASVAPSKLDIVEDNPPPLENPPQAPASPTPTPPAPVPVPPLSREPVSKDTGLQDRVEDTPAPLAASTARATRAPAPKVSGEDDLRRIKGIGPKLVGILAEEGVTTFAQIAAWTESDIAEIDAKLGRFQGRITRDQWVEQARLLISGDKDAYAQKFGKNG